MRDLKQSQEYMSDSNDDFLAELKKVTVEQKNMKNELHSVASRQTKVFSELDDIKRRLNKLEGEKIASGVVVRGMDETDDATASLVQLANALEVHVDAETDIIKAQWIQVRRNDQSTALMQAELANETKKKELIKAAKTKRITTAMLTDGDSNGNPIYVDEMTTPQTRALFAEARKLRDVGVKYVWVSNGDVLVRENDGAKVQRVDSMHHIERIKRNIACGGNNRDRSPRKRRLSSESEPERPAKRTANANTQNVNINSNAVMQNARSKNNTRNANDIRSANTHTANARGTRANNHQQSNRVDSIRQSNCYVLSPAHKGKSRTRSRVSRSS